MRLSRLIVSWAFAVDDFPYTSAPTNRTAKPKPMMPKIALRKLRVVILASSGGKHLSNA
jgi:hypothetical protein